MYYGVSLFENQVVRGENAVKERGARMCAAGLLSSRFTRLNRHVAFLKEAVGYHAAEKQVAQQLLRNYYEQQRNRPRRPPLESKVRIMPRIPRVKNLNNNHPARYFTELLERMGPAVFVVWKHAILNKRILFSSQPPIETGCGYVYCTCLMASCAEDILDKDDPPEVLQPLFNIGVNDLFRLTVLEGYCACTSDKIFGEKADLYDLFIIPQTIPRKRNRPPRQVLTLQSHVQHNSSVRQDDMLTRVNAADRKRWRDLADQYPRLPVQQGLWEILERWWRSRGENAANTSGNELHREERAMTREEVTNLLEPLLQEQEMDKQDQVREITIEHSTPAEEGVDINAELIGYFQSLNTTLLRHLRFILSELDSGRDGYVWLRPFHLEDLGLHPRDDVHFVEQLCTMYFAEFGPVRVVPEQSITARLKQKVQSMHDPSGLIRESSAATVPLLNMATLTIEEEDHGKKKKKRHSKKIKQIRTLQAGSDDDWDSDL